MWRGDGVGKEASAARATCYTRRMTRWILPLLVVATIAAAAQPVGVGGSLPRFRLADQHDAPYELDPAVTLLVVTHDMDGGTIVRETLGETPQATLDARGIVYVADIGGMPALVSRLIALPRMRKRPYRVVLDRDGAVTRELPAAAGKATVVRLDALRVTSIEQVGSRDALHALLFPPAP